ncbi:hypothetical protein F4821DRAFT_277319 [Hypoxylon rubiginosum]|uniref:Uncharacterized protein n=1 Tax=Hypoxylon rubiginosum TaxID=110542 RepID=A0ACC0D6H9_9PEZI|nr:hypothetical protein F4821DRAFT_277319 [Hypoxylon rubiginosum]
MKLQLFTTALVSLVYVSSALPAFEDVKTLETRANEIKTINGLPSKTIKCGDKTKYTKTEIQKAIEKGGQLQNEGNQVGPDRDNKYPFAIKDPDSLPGMPDAYKDAKNMQHFPMKNGKSAYNGARKPKPERVMYTHDKGSDEATYVGLWTHEGASTGQYKQCVEDSGDASAYNTGWCTAHVAQYQRNENGVGGAYAFDVTIYDDQGDQIGQVQKQAVDGSGKLAVTSALPDTLDVTAGANDDDDVSFCYGSQCWTCDGSDGGGHDCTLGNGQEHGYENGNREGDLGFSC